MTDQKGALDVMAREELGIDPNEMGGSPWVAAWASFALFAVGAIVPVLPSCSRRDRPPSSGVSTFDAVLFVGYHASTTSVEGVRAHTMSSANFADIRLNGISVPEAGLNAAIAGHFGVPVVLITGDAAIVKEARALLGSDLEGAVVKWPYGFHSARTITPEAACELIREKAKIAVTRAGERKPYRLKIPVELEICFKNYRPAELLAYLPNVERTDTHSVHFRGKDILEVARFLEFVLNYEPGLAP